MISPRKGKAPEMMDSPGSGGIKPVSPRGPAAGPAKNYEDIVRVLADIKIRNQKIKEIIKRSPPEDIEEFSSTNLLVEASVQRLLNQVPILTKIVSFQIISYISYFRIRPKCLFP
jgi:hypothetical protein